MNGPKGCEMERPDVQGNELHRSYHISRVGVTGIKRPVVSHRPGRDVSLVPVFDISVNLPAEQRGSHMSRHVEVINRSIEKAVEEDNDSLENLVRLIAFDLLRTHEYATYADVKVKADYFREMSSPDDRRVIENYIIISEARIRRGDERPSTTIGVEVSGMSACPCAMETVRTMLKEELRTSGATEDQVKVLDMIPVPTHNQKNRTTITLGSNGPLELEANDLIDLVERSLSSPTYEILKREGEGKVVLTAHRNPRFVEDIVRDVIDDLLGSYPGLADDVTVHVRSVSEESIHKHDAFAERIASLGELREGSRHVR